MTAPFHLRRYRATDEDAAIELWRRTWQLSYPEIDFSARLEWWRRRWRDELVPNATIIVAEQNGAMAGFATIDATGYLDQIVVAPQAQGSALATMLIDRAKELSPDGITLLVNLDNHRAIRFYQKNGFRSDGEDVNPISGRNVLRMAWGNPATSS